MRFHKGDVVKVTKEIQFTIQSEPSPNQIRVSHKIRKGMMGVVKNNTQLEYLGGDLFPIVEFDFNPYMSITLQVNPNHLEIVSEDDLNPNFGFKPYDGEL